MGFAPVGGVDFLTPTPFPMRERVQHPHFFHYSAQILCYSRSVTIAPLCLCCSCIHSPSLFRYSLKHDTSFECDLTVIWHFKYRLSSCMCLSFSSCCQANFMVHTLAHLHPKMPHLKPKYCVCGCGAK